MRKGGNEIEGNGHQSMLAMRVECRWGSEEISVGRGAFVLISGHLSESEI